MGHIEITRASQEDAEIILHLQMHAYLSEAEIYNDYSIPPLIQTLKEIRQEFSEQVLNALEEGEKNSIYRTVDGETSLPLLRTSRVAPIFAKIDGCRYITPVIIVPNFILDVTPARTDIVVQLSSIGSSCFPISGI